MSEIKRRFSPAEKAKIAILAIKGEMTMAEICSKFLVQSGQVNRWKSQALEALPKAFSEKTDKTEKNLEKESSGLYQEIGRLKIENDFLKKKLRL